MIRYILCSAILLALMGSPADAKKRHFHSSAPKHALLVKHPRLLPFTVHIPARALHKATRKPPHRKHKSVRR